MCVIKFQFQLRVIKPGGRGDKPIRSLSLRMRQLQRLSLTCSIACCGSSLPGNDRIHFDWHTCLHNKPAGHQTLLLDSSTAVGCVVQRWHWTSTEFRAVGLNVVVTPVANPKTHPTAPTLPCSENISKNFNRGIVHLRNLCRNLLRMRADVCAGFFVGRHIEDTGGHTPSAHAQKIST